MISNKREKKNKRSKEQKLTEILSEYVKKCILRETDSFQVLQVLFQIQWTVNGYFNTTHLKPSLYFQKNNFSSWAKYDDSDQWSYWKF